MKPMGESCDSGKQKRPHARGMPALCDESANERGNYRLRFSLPILQQALQAAAQLSTDERF